MRFILARFDRSPSSLRRPCSLHRWWAARRQDRHARATSTTTTRRSPAPGARHAAGAAAAEPRRSHVPGQHQVERAQLFMNQGLNLAYGFNHAEAARAFAEAARLDPTLPWPTGARRSCSARTSTRRWTPDDEPKALALAQKALALKAKATPRERAYIDAVAARYTGNAEDRAKADRAYADAMERVTQRSPTISMRARFTPRR